MTRRLLVIAGVACCLVLATLVASGRVEAQTPTASSTPTPSATAGGTAPATPTTTGSSTSTPAATPTPPPVAAQVTGHVTAGTAGDVVPDGLTVRLIALDGANVTTAAETTTKGGTYTLSAQATPGLTYVPHLVYQTVDYFGDAITFSPTSTKVQHDFVVYATTHDAPQLTITSTTVTLVAIDRQAHQLGFEREDAIANPSDLVYLGDSSGVTLHFPAPDGTVEASGEGAPETFTFEHGVVSAAVPIRPGTVTTVVTRYLVGYDAAADTYRLRVTAPLPSEQMKVRVPAEYAAMRATTGVEAAPDEQTVPDASAAGATPGQVLKVMRATAGAQPGGSILVDLVGLSGHLQSNPLTDRPGAIAGSVAALVILAGGILASLAWRARRSRLV